MHTALKGMRAKR